MQFTHDEYLLMAPSLRECRSSVRARIQRGTVGRCHGAAVAKEDPMLQCIEKGMPEETIEDKLLSVFDTETKQTDIEKLETMLKEKRESLHTEKK